MNSARGNSPGLPLAARARRSAAIASVFAALLASTLGPNPASAVPVAYDIDPAHSAVTFQVRHFFSMVPGQFKQVAGTVLFDAETPEASSVDITIQAVSVDTRNEKRDGHLRTSDFFEADKHPTITFKSTKVMKTETKDMFKVEGDLTMRGVTKPAVLDVELLGAGPDGMGGERAGFAARTTVNRKDYGILWNKTLDTGGTMLGDEVKIEFLVEAVKKTAP